MVSKQVTLCDGCGKRTAERKCSWCGKDLCKNCSRTSFRIQLKRSTYDTIDVGSVGFCRICKNKLQNIWTAENQDELIHGTFSAKISTLFQDYFRDISTLHGLEDKK